MVHYRVLAKEQVRVNDPKAVQSILTTQAAIFPRDSTTRMLFQNMLGGDGLFSSEGSVHDNQRKVLNGSSSASQVKASLGIIYSQTLRWCSSVLDAAIADGTPVNLSTTMPKLTLNVLGLAAFDYDFAANPAAGKACEEMGRPIPMFLVTLVAAFTAATTRGKRSCAIENKLQAKADPTRPKDLLDRMLDAKVDSRDAIVHTMTFMFAGHETDKFRAQLGDPSTDVSSDHRGESPARLPARVGQARRV
ncbi:hypothetical protein AC1031_001909 [Aphanomyces cochlioides]|nr:hypothetical protein AC1031_001909 [Aphanomyces cochlioides]